MGFVAIISLAFGVCGVLLVGCGFSPRRSAHHWGRVFHAEEHFDHLYSRQWFEHFLVVVKQEQLSRIGGVFVLASLVAQQFAGFGKQWMTLLVGIGVGLLAGILLSLIIRATAASLCRASVARQVEIIAVQDIRAHRDRKESIEKQVRSWFEELVGREACIETDQRAVS